jgi:hypothetical protein
METPDAYPWFAAHLPFFFFLALAFVAAVLYWAASEMRKLNLSMRQELGDSRRLLDQVQLRQNESSKVQFLSSIKPVLVLVVEQATVSMGEGKLGLQKLLLRNIGAGPAFNIRIRGFEVHDYRLEFDPLDYIEKGTQKPFPFVVSSGGQYSGLSRSLILLETALLAEKSAVISKVPIEFAYDDMAGNRYKSTAELSVDHMSGKISVTYPAISSPASAGDSADR